MENLTDENSVRTGAQVTLVRATVQKDLENILADKLPPSYSLNVWPDATSQDGPDAWFSFPGKKGSALSLPAFAKWPSEDGFTFSTWFRLDPANSIFIEKQAPHLYCFKTSMGIGYSAHFTGSNLVLGCITEGALNLHYVKFQFFPRKWYALSIVHEYCQSDENRMKCFVDGQLVTDAKMNWPIRVSEPFDMCYIGATPQLDEERVFCGQMAAVYLFSEALSTLQVGAIHRLGPSYRSQFMYDSESHGQLPENYRSVVYDGKLHTALVLTYSPLVTDGQICIQLAPKGNTSYFVRNSHALMLQDVHSVATCSIQSSLCSLGGIQVLYPFFEQLDLLCDKDKKQLDYSVCGKLLTFIVDLLQSSITFQQQMVQSCGFLVISYLLHKSDKDHLSMEVLEAFLSCSKFLMTSLSPHADLLLKQLLDHILLNPGLWIHASVTVQLKLYSHLATELVKYSHLYSSDRRVTTVRETVHTLKYYYWQINPKELSGIVPKGLDGTRPGEMDMQTIRSFIIQFLKQLIELGKDSNEDDLKIILNYLSTVYEDDNLLDLLKMLVALMNEIPSFLVTGLDSRIVIKTVFKLMSTPNTTVIFLALKLLGFFLARLTDSQKRDLMTPHNLYMMLAEKILVHEETLTLHTYNVLYEILIEKIGQGLLYASHPQPDDQIRMENPEILKVVATIIKQSKPSEELLKVKRIFLSDLIMLCKNNSDNSKKVVVQPVWQEWLISMAHINPRSSDESGISDMVYSLFQILLHHSIKYRFGGWRVWVDTLAIVHLKEPAFNLFDSSTNANSLEKQIEVPLEDMSETVETTESSNSPEVTFKSNSLPDETTHCEQKTKPAALSDDTKDIEDPCQLNAADIVTKVVEAESLEKIVTTNIVDKNLSSGILADKSNSASEENKPEFIINKEKDNEHCIINRDRDDKTESYEGHKNICSRVHANTEKPKSLAPSQQMPIKGENGIILSERELVDPHSPLQTITDKRRKGGEPTLSPGAPRFSFGIPEFRWSLIHQKLLDDLLVSLESDIQNWRISKSDIQELENINSAEEVFVYNTLLFISHLADNLILACGGLNPLLACVMHSTCEVDFVQPNQGLSVEMAACFLQRLVYMSDYFLYASFVKFNKLEAEKDMPKGGILRQYLRLVFAVSAQNCLEAKERLFHRLGWANPFNVSRAQHCVSLIRSARTIHSDVMFQYQVYYPDSLLREVDACRLRSLLRTTLKNHQKGEIGQEANLSLAIVYFISSLMVSRYDEILKQLTLPPRCTSSATLPPASCSQSQDLLMQLLESGLGVAASLLREVMVTYAQFLSKRLLGSNGQELLNIESNKKIITQSTSVLQLVMLLCSQEWQYSLEHKAGSAFIELTNEGMSLSKAMEDHITRVAKESVNFVNEMQVVKHSEFEALCATTLAKRREAEEVIDQTIVGARKRNAALANRLVEHASCLPMSRIGAWGISKESDCRTEHLKLDALEDNCRRRKLFVWNPLGTTHSEAILIPEVNSPSEDEEYMWGDLSTSLSTTKLSQGPAENHDDSEDSDFDTDLIGPVSLSCKAKLIAPGIVAPGTLSVTSNELYFEADEDDPDFKKNDPGSLGYCENLHGKWHFSEMTAIFSRRYLLRSSAIEIFLSSRTTIMFALLDQGMVKRVIKALPRVGVGDKFGIPQTRRASMMTPCQLMRSSDIVEKWRRREISNFKYLMFLNTIAGRTYNDINQYPIFPWVLTNYEATELDLRLPSNYRDLSKPVGALNPARNQYFEERYSNWEHDSIPPSHYLTHYSTEALTLNWMLRVEPFTTIYLAKKNGKFDYPNRLFTSMQTAWTNCQKYTSDVKELIPELFYMPEMLMNCNRLNLGKDENGTPVSNVRLPPWAHSPEEFVRIHRMALESDIVSCQLHQWIDLIFGYKQQGLAAVKANNVFYYLTYEGSVDLDSVVDPILREGIENQIRNFGKTPSQLLLEPHPKRRSKMCLCPMIYPAQPRRLDKTMNSMSPIIHVAVITHPELLMPNVLTITDNFEFHVYGWKSGNPENTSEVSGLIDSYPRFMLNLGDSLSREALIKSPSFLCMRDSLFVIVAGFWDGSFRIYSTKRGNMQQIVFGHHGIVTSLAHSENYCIASGSEDGTILLWRWNTSSQSIMGEGGIPTPYATLTGHDRAVVCLAVSEEMAVVASGSQDGHVLVHSIFGNLLRALPVPSGVVDPQTVSLSREGLAVVGYSHGHIVASTVNGKLLKHESHGDNVSCGLLTFNGEYLITGGARGIVEIRRAFSLALLYDFPACGAPIKSLAISHDEKFIFVVLSNGSFEVFHIDFNRWEC